ncbi:hypothetical protein HUT06_31795 [Actinomadura sp. NAK00032]|uniref:hypothetical protein n=1 Tax=Actinomadura sp. NAK00032 TaxID=2742128 RepID=UPI001590F86A|nr:hypothetical protein [Actinomadura sp. NAK00032]QKW38017.1 hypothetical protein HUT06_31795 [Actinomadura sp. NAK00032]
MDALPGNYYSDPDSWSIEGAAGEAVLSMVTPSGVEPIFRSADLEGSFVLGPSGLLSGFTLDLDLPEHALSARRWGRSPSSLSWEASGLRPTETRPHGLEGRGTLALGHRDTRTALSGTCTQVPNARTGAPYLKIVLQTVFASAALWWPREARRRLRPVELTLFAEIRPVRIGPGAKRR